ncbi:hypothetical protein ACFZBU_32015 [Embleya sp. NPDC008237]|uniref:hypothetical protein n=1 Tax=Embleya sp. NPDC008237 TaxID=3363978 RepID=UPI0036EBCC6C
MTTWSTRSCPCGPAGHPAPPQAGPRRASRALLYAGREAAQGDAELLNFWLERVSFG